MAAQSVTELVIQLKQALERGIGEQRVLGEIGSCKAASSGHIYFTLKDSNSQLQCVLYRYQAAAYRHLIREGAQVELTGHPTIWEGRGSLQFIVKAAKLAGQGNLQQQFEALKNKLAAEGLFDQSRKRAIPSWPASLGLITSASGAVIEDMRHRLENRAPWMQVYLIPCQVQGKGAERGLARAVEAWGSERGRASYKLPQVDYLIIARGGGSLEDLWNFNEEVLARAIASCDTPIISAVGHETDFTIADFVADMRAPTPTAAIELSTPDQHSFVQWLEAQEQGMKRQLQKELHRAQLQLRIAEQSSLRNPRQALAPFEQRLDTYQAEIVQIFEQHLQCAYHRLNVLEAQLSPRIIGQNMQEKQRRLDLMQEQIMNRFWGQQERQHALLLQYQAQIEARSPQNALDRGFALVEKGDRKLLRDSKDVQQGDIVNITLARGQISATVSSE